MLASTRWGLYFMFAGAFTGLHAQPAIFHGADLKLGQKLIDENKCVECHASKVPGDGSAIYKPKGRINTAGMLRGTMVGLPGIWPPQWRATILELMS